MSAYITIIAIPRRSQLYRNLKIVQGWKNALIELAGEDWFFATDETIPKGKGGQYNYLYKYWSKYSRVAEDGIMNYYYEQHKHTFTFENALLDAELDEMSSIALDVIRHKGDHIQTITKALIDKVIKVSNGPTYLGNDLVKYDPNMEEVEKFLHSIDSYGILPGLNMHNERLIKFLKKNIGKKCYITQM